MASALDLLAASLTEFAKVKTRDSVSAAALTNGKAKVRQAETALQTPPVVPPTPPPAAADIRWGGREDGSAYGYPEGHDAPWDATTLNTFEQHTGKRPSLIAYGQPFGMLDIGPLQLCAGRGATPLVETTFPIAEILSGTKNAAIDAISARAKEFGKEILLAPGWEMNGEWFAWGQNANYASAWRYLVNRMRSNGVTNVKFLWAVNTISAYSPDPAPYYPGDEYVDYVGVDGYNHGVGSAKPDKWLLAADVFDPTLTRLGVIAPTKKVIINETGSTEHGGDKAAWITDFLSIYLPARPQIVGFSWFNDVADASGMDWIIETSLASQEAFKAGIAASYYRAGA